MPALPLSPTDQFLSSCDVALRTLFAKPRAARPMPLPSLPLPQANADEPHGSIPVGNLMDAAEKDRRHAAGLMRVNHVGEICAQALYSAQALMAKSPERRAQFEHAAKEETDHLAWTQERLTQLGARPSLLNPLWYAGAFGLGLLAGKLGDRISLGFVVETEAQVEAHLASHLVNDQRGLPMDDHASRAIVAQMQLDEAAHGQAAREAGANELPATAKEMMRMAAKVMTHTAYRL